MAFERFDGSSSCSASTHAAALSGADGKLERVMVRSSRYTRRLVLSTSVRALNQMTPKVGSLAPVGWTETAACASSSLSFQLSSCGW